MKKGFILMVFLLLGGLLIFSLTEMPLMSDPSAPSYNETTEYYLKESVNDTGAINVVAALITDYRAFDTLGETIVLFTAIIAVVSVLRLNKVKEE